MSIAQRQIIALASGKLEVPNPLSKEVAGLAFIFLVSSIAIYWILVALFELKLIDVILCKKGSRDGDKQIDTGRKSLMDAHNSRMSHFEANDEDIVEETKRVKERKPESLPVRVNNVSKNYGSVKAVKHVSFGLDYGECFALLGISGAGKTSIFKCLTGEIYPTAGELTINGHDITTSSGF
jgi:ABC-type multidrug transport system fused ATPase/permease subunit